MLLYHRRFRLTPLPQPHHSEAAGPSGLSLGIQRLGGQDPFSAELDITFSFQGECSVCPVLHPALILLKSLLAVNSVISFIFP